ncbi:hypothetical protein Q9R19_08245 [Microbacterium sp. ARD32]|uniref:hypothetical protein n=1 Tax=Microbacterium sp. ARD32 TaxID=2962577 RepID=UPI0028821581|nr:hypothetical protein [Microbacterium sp. ARD32]MDT0157609.1 hypothetical protein [Microbacterium sp. ARD32]
MNADAKRSPIDLSDDQRLALRRAARNGEYHLMLGAGASLDSISPAGGQLPGSGKLIEQLCSEFGVIAEVDDWLWRVYDRAVEKAGEDAVYSWFRSRFWNVKPPYWMAYYARSPWSSVWTLNVDDTYEAAHLSVATDTTRSLQTLNWDDAYRQGRALSVIHLHGVVDRAETRKLVFSLSEYAGSAAARAAWPVNFRDSYGNSPFVILGARLRDEPDIESVIARRSPTNPAPSFYVARTISPATRDDLIRWGLVPVEMTAEDFVLEWAELTGLDLEHDLENELELGMRVGQQFEELRADVPAKLQTQHDFLGGDEPLWEDIQRGLPAELGWVTQAKMDANQIGKSISSASVLAYTGRRLTGRSTGLLVLAQHMRGASWRTFFFRESGRIDVDAVLGFAADGKSIALMFDGMADVADDIDRLVTEARAAGLSVVCLAVDLLENEAKILGRVRPANLAHGRIGNIAGRLSGSDAAHLVDALGRVGRLGVLESKTDAGRLAHFRNRDLFDSMAQIENAPGFGNRLGELLDDVSGGKLKVVLFAAYAALVGHQLLVIDAARMVGTESDALVRAVQSDPQLSSLLTTDGVRLRARHRWMALEPAVQSLGTDAAASIVRDGVRSVSARLSQQSLRERNPTSLLVGALMSQKNLRRAFPGADLDAWYGSLLDVFGEWSGRYWEQRAILARRAGRTDVANLAKAESFALRAVEIVPDIYSLTTLGTVLLEKAALAQVSVADYYERAFSAFERAAGMDLMGSSLVTWIAYLRYSLRVLRRLSRTAVTDSTTEESILLKQRVETDWRRIYAQLAVVRDAGATVSRDLAGLAQEFESVAKTTSAR